MSALFRRGTEKKKVQTDLPPFQHTDGQTYIYCGADRLGATPPLPLRASCIQQGQRGKERGTERERERERERKPLEERERERERARARARAREKDFRKRRATGRGIDRGRAVGEGRKRRRTVALFVGYSVFLCFM